jgi:hypothetical protein
MGGYIEILDANGRMVIRKVTNTLSIEAFRLLEANLFLIVAACNQAGAAQEAMNDKARIEKLGPFMESCGGRGETGLYRFPDVDGFIDSGRERFNPDDLRKWIDNQVAE